MGLDFSHGNAHWPYSGFHRFRERLAAHEGFDLNTMAGFASPGGRSWEEVTTALTPLLNHSDCDGELTAAQCAQVAPRLKEIVSTWPEDDYDHVEAKDLIKAMAVCAASGQELQFV